MPRFRIFVDFALPPDLLQILRDGTQGHELIFPERPVASVLDKAEADPRMATAEIVFGQPDPVDVFRSPALRWIHISSSGITRYDTPEFRAQLVARGIAFSNSASVYHESCATHLLSFILAQARALPRALATRAPGGSVAWHALRATGIPLEGQTVLIVGYGAIGRRLAELLQPFRMNLRAYRRKARGDENIPVISEDELGDALAAADHVIDILPESPATQRFFGAARFAQMKPGAIFYNIGRGASVDQAALLASLQSRRLAAAWLDVTDPEPLPDDHPLWSEANCFITPHVAGGFLHETETLVRHFLRNFERFLRAEPLQDKIGMALR